MVADAGQAILHATIAALVIEALLWLWRVRDPGERLRLRWIVLLCPLATAAFLLFAPARSTGSFGVSWALLSGARWDQLRVGGVGIATGLTCVLAALGIALYLRDAIPFVADRATRRTPDQALPDSHPAVARVRAQVAACTGPGDLPLPALTVVDLATPLLLCTGVDRPTIVVSTGTLDRLSDEELRAALTHEIAHAASRDPLMGWWLMVARSLQCFNPAVQIVGRQAVVEIERRADLAAVGRGRARELAAAIGRLGDEPDSQSDLVASPGRTSVSERVQSGARRHALADRCARLLVAEVPAASGLSSWHLALAAGTLTLLLFFVV